MVVCFEWSNAPSSFAFSSVTMISSSFSRVAAFSFAKPGPS
jgi:hypothetical protein